MNQKEIEAIVKEKVENAKLCSINVRLNYRTYNALKNKAKIEKKTISNLVREILSK